MPLRAKLKRDTADFSYVFDDNFGNTYTEDGSNDGEYKGSNGLTLKQRKRWKIFIH